MNQTEFLKDFKHLIHYGRMRPNEFSGAKIGGGYDAPRGILPTWEPSWDQNAGITHQDLGGYEVMPAGGSKWSHKILVAKRKLTGIHGPQI